MKHNKIIFSVLLAAIVIVSGPGCKKSQFAINANPDDATSASVSHLDVLPATQSATATIVSGGSWRFLQNWMGFWARSGDYQAITDEETYTFTNGFQAGIWNALYYNATNYKFVQDKANAAGAGRYEAIARIMKAMDFQMLVDLYGNVPYTEAFGGIDKPNPKYDKGIDIYKDLFRELDAAIALLKDPVKSAADANPNIATNDLVYAGNTTLWIKFANTLKLRLIIHASQVPGFPVAAEMTIINNEGNGFLGSGQSAHINPGYTTTKPTPYWRAYVSNESGTQQNDIVRANSYAINYYKLNADTFRMKKFYTQRPDSAALRAPESPEDKSVHYRGVPYGQPANAAFGGNSLSTVRGDGYLPQGAASRAWILTSVESIFLQAEARHRGIITTGDANSLHIAGIRESFLWLGLNTAQADAYMAYNAGWEDVDYTAGGLYAILSQKWFGLNGISTLEIWTDYRRTNIVYGDVVGYDPGPPISVWPDNTSTIIPVRLLYPQSEYNYNAANVAAEGTINRFTSKIFWDL
jgi:hypothetical protein